MSGALAGLLVVDISPMMPGHFCSMILGDLGARVIKVERPGRGDYSRGVLDGTFEAVNRNKEGLTLDLKQPQAQEVLHRLVGRADVLVEGFRPGVVRRLGADYQTLGAIKPDLVYCSLSGYGQTGPLRDEPGHDPNYLSVAGVLSMAGDPAGPPSSTVGASMADLTGAWFGAISILAALYARPLHGGQYIDLALTDAAFALMQTRIPEYFLNGRPDKAMLMARPGIGLFQAADGQSLTVGAAEDHFWVAMCRALGLDDWCMAERFASAPARMAAGGEIREGLAAAFAARPRDEWVAILRKAGVPVAPVNDLSEAATGDYAAARGIVHWMEREDAPPMPHIRFPGLLSGTPASIRSAAPGLGEHTDALLAELGYDGQEIDALRQMGAV